MARPRGFHWIVGFALGQRRKPRRGQTRDGKRAWAPIFRRDFSLLSLVLCWLPLFKSRPPPASLSDRLLHSSDFLFPPPPPLSSFLCFFSPRAPASSLEELLVSSFQFRSNISPCRRSLPVGPLSNTNHHLVGCRSTGFIYFFRPSPPTTKSSGHQEKRQALWFELPGDTQGPLDH